MVRSDIDINAVAYEGAEQKFLRYARRCQTRDLRQLQLLCVLVNELAELIHALQKERGAASIFLGSGGQHFSDLLGERVTESLAFERVVRSCFDRIDEGLDLMLCGARFHVCVALACRALDTLSAARAQIAVLALMPQEAAGIFTGIIGSLLAVIFEVADVAADPAVSRAVIALVNLSQGKEYAGQERATAGAAISRGHFHAEEQRRWRQLIGAQEQAFRIFNGLADASHVASLARVTSSPEWQRLKCMRDQVLTAGLEVGPACVTAEEWFEVATLRIDALKHIEADLSRQLSQLCESRLEDAGIEVPLELGIAHGAMLVAMVDPATCGVGVGVGIGLYSTDAAQARTLRPIYAVLQAQWRRIEQVSHELESARNALSERKTIERAKGLLMKSRGLSEQEAYAQIRHTAMSQNKRIADIAEAVVSMAPIPGRP
jgi:hypothetical protein